MLRKNYSPTKDTNGNTSKLVERFGQGGSQNTVEGLYQNLGTHVRPYILQTKRSILD